MADRRFKEAINSLIEVTRRNLIEDAVIKVPVLGGVGVGFGNIPNVPVEITSFNIGLVVLPIADEAPAGWGFPYDSGGLIDPPRGTLGGTEPQGIFLRDGVSSATFTRSDTWFPANGSIPMSDQCGGSDWQSGNGAEVITYGILGRGRYISVPGDRVFKDGGEITLTPAPSRVGAVSSMVQQGDNVILVATSILFSNNVIKIFAYTMTDDTVTVQDGGVAVQEILSYDLINLQTIEDTQFRTLQFMNFSADGAKLVVVTGQGDLVEFAIAPGTLNVTITEELSRTDVSGDNYTIADYTENIIPPVPVYGWSCTTIESVTFPGTFGAFITDWLETATNSSTASMSKTGVLSRILISDFDLLTGDRLDLKIEVTNPTRTYTQNGNQINQYFDTTDPLNPDPELSIDAGTDSGWCGNNSPNTPGVSGVTHPFAAVPLVNDNFCRIDEPLYELKLGSTVIDTFQGFGEITSSLTQEHTLVRDEKLNRIIIADLRTGFVAYDKERLDLDFLDLDGSGSDVRTQTRDNIYKVVGGQNLPDFEDTSSLDVVVTQEMLCQLWFFKHDEPQTGGAEPDIDFPIFTNDTIPSAIIKTTFNSHGISAPDLELAVVDFKDPVTSALESRYTAFSKGVAAQIAQIDQADLGGGVVSTTEPRCLPKGLI